MEFTYRSHHRTTYCPRQTDGRKSDPKICNYDLFDWPSTARPNSIDVVRQASTWRKATVNGGKFYRKSMRCSNVPVPGYSYVLTMEWPIMRNETDAWMAGNRTWIMCTMWGVGTGSTIAGVRVNLVGEKIFRLKFHSFFHPFGWGWYVQVGGGKWKKSYIDNPLKP